jgi:hypothetical protein
MKKLIASALFVVASLTSIAQSKSLVAKIDNNKASFSQTADGSTTKFQLSATADQIKSLKNQAATLSDRIQLAVEAGKEKTNYNCVLTITHQNHAEYVHKMFVYLGINEIKIDGVVKPVADLSDALKNLK